jgi:transcription elongation GreA/GreB family factor
MNREQVLEALIASLRAELDAAQHMVQMSLDEATHRESKAENKYDTRSLEASYLASGQGARVLALRRLVTWAESTSSAAPTRAALGSLVTLEDDETRTMWAILLPDGGGHRLTVGGRELVVLTPDSPLGRALLGLEADEECEVHAKGGKRTWTVLSLD